jgi:hypothetical protein
MTKTNSKVMTYLDHLLVIGTIARGESNNHMLNKHNHIKIPKNNAKENLQ